MGIHAAQGAGMSWFNTALGLFFASTTIGTLHSRQTPSLESRPASLPAYPLLTVSCNSRVDFNTSYTLLLRIEMSPLLKACASADGGWTDLDTTMVLPVNNQTYQIGGSNDTAGLDTHWANLTSIDTRWTNVTWENSIWTDATTGRSCLGYDAIRAAALVIQFNCSKDSSDTILAGGSAYFGPGARIRL
jgi:hypothetical protein